MVDVHCCSGQHRWLTPSVCVGCAILENSLGCPSPLESLTLHKGRSYRLAAFSCYWLLRDLGISI